MIKSYGVHYFSLKSGKIVQLYRNVFIIHHNKSKVLNETRPLQQKIVQLYRNVFIIVLNETRPLQENIYLTFIQVNRVDVLLVKNTSKILET